MSFKKVRIICPVCQGKKFVPIPEEEVKGSKSGATAIFIPAGVVCDHDFYAYLDKNFAVRDYLALDYSEGKDEFNKIKTKIANNSLSLDLTWERVSQYIKEKDLKSLLFGYYVGNPFIFIQDDFESEDFEVVFGLMCRLHPNFYKNCTLMKPESYLKFSEEGENKIAQFIVYNIKHKILVKKPFSDSNTDNFSPLMVILKHANPENMKIQMVYAKNWLDYMKFFTKDGIVKDEKIKAKKASKQLKKDNSTYSNFFSADLIETMRKRIKIKKLLSMLNTNKN